MRPQAPRALQEQQVAVDEDEARHRGERRQVGSEELPARDGAWVQEFGRVASDGAEGYSRRAATASALGAANNHSRRLQRRGCFSGEIAAWGQLAAPGGAPVRG